MSFEEELIRAGVGNPNILFQLSRQQAYDALERLIVARLDVFQQDGVASIALNDQNVLELLLRLKTALDMPFKILVADRPVEDTLLTAVLRFKSPKDVIDLLKDDTNFRTPQPCLTTAAIPSMLRKIYGTSDSEDLLAEFRDVIRSRRIRIVQNLGSKSLKDTPEIRSLASICVTCPAIAIKVAKTDPPPIFEELNTLLRAWHKTHLGRSPEENTCVEIFTVMFDRSVKPEYFREISTLLHENYDAFRAVKAGVLPLELYALRKFCRVTEATQTSYRL